MSTFILKLGCRERPLPAFSGGMPGCRWEYRCGWCQNVFETPQALVRHVVKERNR